LRLDRGHRHFSKQLSNACGDDSMQQFCVAKTNIFMRQSHAQYHQLREGNNRECLAKVPV
jgi:hypothetical protein